MKKVIPLLLLLALIPTLLLAQNTFRVMGRVTDTKGEPLVGANVFIKALNIGAATDLDGKYSFEVSKDLAKGQQVVLSVTYVGYKSQSVNIILTGNSIEQNFQLEEDIFESETIVVTGIASRTSKSVSEIAVSRIPAAELTAVQSYQGINQLLSGKVAGVQLKPTSGNVGGGFSFFVRGGGGLNGDEQPMIFVDGIRVDNTEIVGYGRGGQGFSILANLNVQDIEKIEVLKGPAAAAMYGTNASNGVVMITTKSGKLMPGLGKAVSIDYKYNFGINTPSFKYKTEDFLSVKDNDRANKIYKDGFIRDHFISASGGTGILRYYASFQNRIEEGILDPIKGDRKTFKVNVAAYPADNLSMKFNTGFAYNFMQAPNNDNNIYGYLGNTLLALWAFTDSAAVANFQDKNNNNQFLGSYSITWSPIPNMDVNASVGMEDSDWRQDQIYPAQYKYGTINKGSKRIYNRHFRGFTYDLNARYSYDIIEGLRSTSIIGTQISDRRVQTSFMNAEQFGSQYIMNIGSGATIREYNEGAAHNRDAGIYFENDFSYKDTYFWTLAVRRDYASAVGRKAPAITYPKASFALRLDKMFELPKEIDLLKLRAAYGVSGQLPANDDGIPLLWSAVNAGHGIGAVLNAIGNESIKPEEIKEIEVGFETEFLNMFSLEFTYFKQNANNSIVDKQNAPSTGLTASAVPFNIGGMKNWGFESLLQFNPIRGRDYNLSFSFIWNYQNNEVTDLGGAQPIFDGFDVNVIKEGMRKHEFYTWKTKGAKFDANGKYIGVEATEDRVDLGNPYPDHYGSFTVNFRFLKNFNFYALAEYGLNNKVYNLTKQFAIQYSNNTTYEELKAKLGLTTKYPEIQRLEVGSAEYKAAAEKYASMNYVYDGNFIEDADFLVIRELSLSYDFTDLISEFIPGNYIRNFVVGFSAYNMFKFSKYTGADIEVNFDGSRSLSRGQDFLTLQNPKVFNFWFQIGF